MFLASCYAQDEDDIELDVDIGASKEGSRTGILKALLISDHRKLIYQYLHCGFFLVSDAEVLKREEEAIKLDGLNVAQMKELRDKSEKFAFQAEVNRMMKLIINSLYRNKEVIFPSVFTRSWK